MPGSRWADYWNAFPAGVDPRDFLRQVGKTVDQQPVAEAHVGRIVAAIASALDLRPADRVLDLCCGNGLLTARVAARCREVVGVDFSRPLIALARQHHGPANVTYACQSALGLRDCALVRGRRFDKAYVYEALQHFEPAELGSLLDGITATAARGGPFRLFIGSVPDRERLDRFYDTPARRAEYERRSRDGTEAIGTWWTRAEVVATARAHGYACTILAQDPALYTAHYRFDALLTRTLPDV